MIKAHAGSVYVLSMTYKEENTIIVSEVHAK
jgi:hypothetical protein